MPAIEIPKLRARLDLLLKAGSESEKLASELHYLFDLYADPTQSINKQNLPGKALRFNCPLILSLEVEKSLQPACQDKPQEMLEVIDALWLFPELELRELAAKLLGKIPVSLSSQVIERIYHWTELPLEEELLRDLLKFGSVTLRKKEPEIWLSTLKKWSGFKTHERVSVAIQGLIPLIEDDEYSNFPSVFTFLYSFFQPFQADFFFELETIITALTKRSEIETVYFLKQVMGTDQNRNYGRFIRRILDQFSPTNQASLKQALKDHPNLN